jgi:DNA-binding LytR/AlgR family response regulator
MDGNNKLRILIVEDEYLTIDLLRNIIQDLGHEVSGDAMSAHEAMAVLELKNTDLVFLDINLKGDYNGIWLSQVINKSYGLPFLFITAYSDSKTIDKAIDSMPLGYLVKPIQQHEVYAAISLALKRLSAKKEASTANADIIEEEGFSSTQTHVFVKSGFNFSKIPLDKIIYIQSFKNYIEINQSDSKILVRKQLGEFLLSLPNDTFLQVHRSYVVNKNYISEVKPNSIVILETEIPIGKKNKENFLKNLKLPSI